MDRSGVVDTWEVIFSNSWTSAVIVKELLPSSVASTSGMSEPYILILPKINFDSQS
ncbi:MAG: hypothetical protein F6K62_17150 [Sphaerospermopsis sp. SIO1G2]|nr:hypothetical protein [Sphaerospermopsis sp. SIO1G2]